MKRRYALFPTDKKSKAVSDMNVDNALADSLRVLIGILVSSTVTCSVEDDKICHGSWTYKNLGNGWGCIRPLTSKFSDRMCLTRGYHVALVTEKDDQNKQKIVCVKDQSERDCRTGKYVTSTTMTSSSESPQQTTMKVMHDTKFIVDESDNKGDDKRALARPFGCCMPGLEG